MSDIKNAVDIICDRCSDKWEKIAHALYRSNPSAIIKTVKEDYKDDLSEQCREFLWKWKEEAAVNCLDDLLEALRKCKLNYTRYMVEISYGSKPKVKDDNGEEILIKAIDVISSNGIDWEPIVHKLGNANIPDIASVKRKYSNSSEEQCRNYLQYHWLEMAGEEATVEALCTALKESNFNYTKYNVQVQCRLKPDNPDFTKTVKQLTTIAFDHISKANPQCWKTLAIELGSVHSIIENIKTKHQYQLQDQCRYYLLRWLEEQGEKASVQLLLKGLEGIKQNNTKEQIIKNIKSYEAGLDHGIGTNATSLNQGNGIGQGAIQNQSNEDHSTTSQVVSQSGAVHGQGYAGLPHQQQHTAAQGAEHAQGVFEFAYDEQMLTSRIMNSDEALQAWQHDYGWMVNNLLQIRNTISNNPNPNPKVNIAIIDSGYCNSHEIFEHRIMEPKYYVECNQDDKYLDKYGHGTACAGIVSIFTPLCVGIRAMKVISKDRPYADFSLVERALDDLLRDDDIDIVSISLGTSKWPRNITDKINELQKRKIVVFSAGNEGDRAPNSQQDAGGIVVGSCDTNGTRSRYSSKGPKLFCLAPGEDVASARGTTHCDFVFFRGTSLATPLVAAVVANVLIKAMIKAGIEQADAVRRFLRNTDIMEQILRKMCDADERTDERGYGILQKWELLEKDDLLWNCILHLKQSTGGFN